MAQAAKALNLARYFTEAGTHPYDQFEWVKRESKIVNPGTGKVVFEQKDAEFPDFWSQNAINIVAQKYFYGTPHFSAFLTIYGRISHFIYSFINMEMYRIS